jgi:integral membrane protein
VETFQDHITVPADELTCPFPSSYRLCRRHLISRAAFRRHAAEIPGAPAPPVVVTGWIHGVLFVIFSVALLRTMLIAKWPVSRCATVFVAALLPFGPFLIDGRMAEWEKESA